MKLKNKLSPKQKTVFNKTPQILAAILFFGILSANFNFEEEVEEQSPSPTIETLGQEEANLNKQETETVLTEVEAPAMETIESEEFEAEKEEVQVNTMAKNSRQTQTLASQRSLATTSSSAAFAQMNMEVENYSGKLSWANSFQRNVKHFAIERSIDDEQYLEIGRIDGKGKGEFSKETFYEFKDTSLMYVQMPSVLYRIKQVGVDGDKNYSDVIEYDMGLPEGLYASVDINPQKELLIHYAATTSGKVAYKILNAVGEPVSQGEVQGEFDSKLLTLEAKQWKSGAYYLQLETEKHSFMEAFEID